MLFGLAALVTRTATGSVEGQVVYVPVPKSASQMVSGLTIPGLELKLRSIAGQTRRVKTDSSGGFRVPTQTLGAYQLEFVGPGGKTYSTRVSTTRQRPIVAISVRLCESNPAPRLEIVSIPRPELRRELLAMAAEDQVIRRRWIASDTTKPHPEAMAAMTDLNLRQVSRLKGWVERYGWPTPNLVGEDGAGAAFLVIQHAEPKTQLAWYPLIESIFNRHQLRAEDYAMFTDRVLLARGQKQRFGTVALSSDKWTKGEPLFEPIEDEEKIDARRAAVGLMPFAEYVEFLKKIYRPPG